MRKRREINVFSISFLDLLSGALGAVIILYVAIPKNQTPPVVSEDPVKELLTQDLKMAEAQLSSAEKQIKELKVKLSALETQISAEPKESKSVDLDIGFKFKGRNIVFLIDTSYSMIDEDRMGQVKAGLKMLLTAMPKTYKVEIIYFPFGARAPFKSLWGVTKETNSENKNDAMDFIYRLRPYGGTPTRETLLFALRNYNDVSDIVLLSDGAPTFHNSNKKDDIFDILKVVREENHRKIQINTIGVGSDFIHDKTSSQYKFLQLLAEESGGFFVGF
jgi:Mg-chelatase subunit ChlD